MYDWVKIKAARLGSRGGLSCMEIGGYPNGFQSEANDFLLVLFQACSWIEYPLPLLKVLTHSCLKISLKKYCLDL